MASALYHMVHIAQGSRAAARFANSDSVEIGQHRISNSTVDRVYQLLPPHMHMKGSTACTEPALMDFVQRQQSESRAVQQSGADLCSQP
jgi:hypothetical protein